MSKEMIGNDLYWRDLVWRYYTARRVKEPCAHGEYLYHQRNRCGWCRHQAYRLRAPVQIDSTARKLRYFMPKIWESVYQSAPRLDGSRRRRDRDVAQSLLFAEILHELNIVEAGLSLLQLTDGNVVAFCEMLEANANGKLGLTNVVTCIALRKLASADMTDVLI